MARRRRSRPAPQQVIAVEGYNEFKRDLGKVSKDLKKDLKGASQKLSELVNKRAQAKARGLGGVAAKSAPALTPKATLKGARIILDGKAYPYALGAEFGSIQYGQFENWTGNRWTADASDIGYFLHPTIYDAVRDRTVLTIYEEELARLDRKAFPDKHRSP